MNLRADFSVRVVVRAAELPWVASPMVGVERRMLDRIGGEVARATTIVRYAAGSSFSPHTHDGGEEFVVLEGVFEDEHGQFPAGCYVRNPPTTSHAPRSTSGCIIFVKLWQFDRDDRTPVAVRMEEGLVAVDAGVWASVLHEDARETVTFERWDEGTRIRRDLPSGAELLVLDGSARERGDELGQHSWLRLPSGSVLDAVAGPRGATVWMKRGHLPFATAPSV